jgi:CheY-like chemotaxis protein
MSNRPTVFVVDDDPNTGRIAKLFLPANDFNVVVCDDGEDAYQKSHAILPDIVFSDVIMPNCDGVELYKRMKQTETLAHIPFIFLQESRSPNPVLPEDTSVDDVLLKPLNAKSLMDAINARIKPVIPLEDHAISIIDPKNMCFQFGIPALDHQFYGSILPESFILIRGPIGSQSRLVRQFIVDGIQKKQPTLLVSFETPKQKLDPVFNENMHQKSYFKFCDASQYSAITTKPWRNIDFIIDYLIETCSTVPYQRIVLDSFSHGFPFWSITEILKCIDLCRTLPNHTHQCIVWTINDHPSIDTWIYHLSHVMDIGIQMDPDTLANPIVEYAKWQSFRRDPVVQQTAIDYSEKNHHT